MDFKCSIDNQPLLGANNIRAIVIIKLNNANVKKLIISNKDKIPNKKIVSDEIIAIINLIRSGKDVPINIHFHINIVESSLCDKQQ